MNIRAFEDLLDHCGGDPADWPPGARAGAERLLAASAQARAALAAMREAEHWLAAPAATAPPDLASRAMRAAQRRPIPIASRFAPGVGWAAAGVVALASGVAMGVLHGPVDDPTQTLAAALAWPTDGVDAG